MNKSFARKGEAMWYVVQTKTGEEEALKNCLEITDGGLGEDSYLVPCYEEVRRSNDVCKIVIRKIFPGYLFVKTDKPEDLSGKLRKLKGFSETYARVLKDNSGEETFFHAITDEDEQFLMSLLEEGLMRVSYIEMNARKRITKIIGPLSAYRNDIAKLDISHRRAIVETEAFNKKHRIRFGLWMKDDPRLAWLETKLHSSESDIQVDLGVAMEYNPGDIVLDKTGVYGDMEFIVKRFDCRKNILYVTAIFMGAEVGFELRGDEVVKAG